MNCSACLSKCKADCCRGPIPMEASLLEKYPHVRPCTHVIPVEGTTMVKAMHVSEDRRAVCPFLGLDDRCSIYHDRPEVCRKFGDESHIFLTCSFQAADGRMRDRAERRRIEKEQGKARQQLLNQR